MEQSFHWNQWIQRIQRIWEITETWIGFSIRTCSVTCVSAAQWYHLCLLDHRFQSCNPRFWYFFCHSIEWKHLGKTPILPTLYNLEKPRVCLFGVNWVNCTWLSWDLTCVSSYSDWKWNKVTKLFFVHSVHRSRRRISKCLILMNWNKKIGYKVQQISFVYQKNYSPNSCVQVSQVKIYHWSIL